MCQNNSEFVIIHQTCGRWRYISAGCGDPTCVECERYKAKVRQEAWLPVVREMDTPRLITLTEKSLPDLEAAWLKFNDDFRRFMDMSLGKVNIKRLRRMADSWLESHHAALMSEGRMTEIKHLEEADRWQRSNDRFFRTLKPKQEDGKPTRLRHLIGPGFASREVTYSEEGWHVHAHLCTDGQFIPHPVLVAAWMIATEGRGEIVDIRHLEVSTETGRVKSMKEVIKYLSKAWEIPEDKHDELRRIAKGKNRIKPLGNARPVIPDPKPCECGDTNCKAHFLGEAHLVSKTEDTIELEAVLPDPSRLPQDHPVLEMTAPAGSEDNTYRLIFKREGREWVLLYLIHYKLAPQERNRRPRQEAPPGDRWEYFRNLQAERA
jgi:hypothetical protein